MKKSTTSALFVLVFILSGCSSTSDSTARVASITLSADTDVIELGSPVSFTAKAVDADGAVLPGVRIKWRSSHPEIGSIGQYGVARGIAIGATEISASVGNVVSPSVQLAVVAPDFITGVIATNVPLPNATVTLSDSKGRQVTGNSDSMGYYSLRTSTLSPPYLVSVQWPDTSRILYGISTDPTVGGTIDVTPFTDVIVRSLLGACGTTPEVAMSSPRDRCHSASGLKVISNAFGQATQFWLKRQGLTKVEFSLIDASLEETGRLLALIQHSPGADLTLASEGLVQEVSLETSAIDSTLVIHSKISGAGGATRSSYRTFVPVIAEAQQAIESVFAVVNQLTQVVREKRGDLAADDVASVLPETFLHDGLNREQFAALKATTYRGADLGCRVTGIGSIDWVDGRLETLVICQVIRDEGTVAETLQYTFTRSAHGWVLSGNDRPARLAISAEVVYPQGAESGAVVYRVRASAAATESTVDGVSIADGAGDVYTMQKSGSRFTTLEPEPEKYAVLTRDLFRADVVRGLESPSEEIAYDFEVQTRDGMTSTHRLITSSITTETVSITNMAGTTPAEARLGRSLHVGWTLPTTFGVASIRIEGEVFSGSGENVEQCSVRPVPLAATASNGAVTFPDSCDGRTVNRVVLRVVIIGDEGQHTTAAYSFVAPVDPSTFHPQVMDLPILRLETEDRQPVVSKDNYLRARMTLEPNGHDVAAFDGQLQIKGRGNTTWGMPKKPYRLKLDAKSALFGMPSSKDWVLLANYSDKSLLRTRAAFELGERVGMVWTPHSTFVEVFLNDEYIGAYQLSQNIKVAKDRVNIDEIDESVAAGEELTGGYLMEVDARLDGAAYFTSSMGVPIVFQGPEEPNVEQFAYAENYINQFEAALSSTSFADPSIGYAGHIDVDAFIRWYLVNELFKNNDAVLFSSCWLYKPRGEKLAMGPLWDFDISAGNINYNGNDIPTGWWVRNGVWFARLLDDAAFVQRVREKWVDMRGDEIPALFDSIKTQAAMLQQAQVNNFQRWPILETLVWPNAVATGSYAGEVEYLRSWLETRVKWMDGQLLESP
ncbi:CotH kinase family protein [Povalibacter sp.]|uniref:CotH kinase family protein n=1 Tax=Povalibacter sp. TaxID=1962978 RepID=UPI002F418D8A